MAELIRGKTGRVYGDLIGLLTIMKGLPLAYNKDLQEDKEGMFDTVKTVEGSLEIFAGMIKTMTVNKNMMKKQRSRIFQMQLNLPTIWRKGHALQRSARSRRKTCLHLHRKGHLSQRPAV